MKCPTCGCKNFYIKDPDDEYEIYEFTTSAGNIEFDQSLERQEIPQITNDIETYCNKCAWHGKYKTLN